MRQSLTSCNLLGEMLVLLAINHLGFSRTIIKLSTESTEGHRRDYCVTRRALGSAIGAYALIRSQRVKTNFKGTSVFRFVSNIGDTYGSALLLHMLTSTVTLTLLAYQATKVGELHLPLARISCYMYKSYDTFTFGALHLSSESYS